MSDQAEIFFDTDQPCCVGIDIGTTTVCACVLKLGDGTPLAVYRTENGSDLPPLFAGDHRQDAERIFSRVCELTDAILARYPGVSAIGLTGQMHGILCADKEGRALTPLYTWQDERARGFCEEISDKTGYRVSTGYGLATVYALMQNGELPAETSCICTVMDYIAAKRCGVPVTQMHTTNAASLGIYDAEKQTFDAEALCKIGIRPTLLPKVSNTVGIIGRYCGIPVTLPIGDNQASFLGSVRDPETTALANFGTGSQISLLAPVGMTEPCGGAVEMRPFSGKRSLLSGSALCGGHAYALLERFFGMYRSALGVDGGTRYDILNTLAAQGYEEFLSEGQRLSVLTAFCGTRDDPALRGAVTGISDALFTPQALTAGVLYGMAEELYAMFCTVPHDQITVLAASGNAVRRNPVFCQILSRVFDMPVQIPAAEEEAAFGAAMTSAVGTGYAASLESLGSWVKYQT